MSGVNRPNDYTMEPRLTIELVPATAWGKNLRSEISTKEWDALRRQTYRQAGYHCEVCGGQGPKHPVECHERWEFDEIRHVQKLVGLIALCPACHEVKHIGRAEMIGNLNRTLRHLADVNNWSIEDARIYAEGAIETWMKRSQFEWSLDLSWLKLHAEENEAFNTLRSI